MKTKICSAVLAFAAAAALAACGGAAAPAPQSPAQPAASASQAEPEFIALPARMECGLTVDALFQYSGLNPDCGDEENDDIASLQITNTTGKYVQTAHISVALPDGTVLNFVLQDIPADSVVYAFDTANTACAAGPEIAQLEAEVSFCEEASLMEAALTVTDTEMVVELGNKTNADLNGLTVTYHSMLDDIIFGGTAYTQQADIPAGQTTALEAWECYLGSVRTVRVAQ